MNRQALHEYAPGQFARAGEVITLPGGHWRFTGLNWERASMRSAPLPPELVARVGDASRGRARQ